MKFWKVVTMNLRSLGLRKNPTILEYQVNKWITSPKIKEGPSDDGGIWVAPSLSNARRLKKYMKENHNKICRIFTCSIGDILY